MKVLYVGVNDGTCLSRFKALRKLEPATSFFSVDRYSQGLGRWGRFLERNAFYGPRARQANADLLDTSDTLQPEIMWVDKAVWVWPSTLKALRRRRCFSLITSPTRCFHATHRRCGPTGSCEETYRFLI